MTWPVVKSAMCVYKIADEAERHNYRLWLYFNIPVQLSVLVELMWCLASAIDFSKASRLFTGSTP